MKQLSEFIEQEVFDVPSTPLLFNLYNDNERSLDLPDGHLMRRTNLCNYLDSFYSRPTTLVLGEAPGHNGLRFTGIPFSSELQLVDGFLPFKGRQSSSATTPQKETSSTIFWGLLKSRHQEMFVWNSVPFHPHKPGNLRSNRPPTNTEREKYSYILQGIVELLQPYQILAVGRSAENSLKKMDLHCTYIRHPSYGGAPQFEAGMKTAFRF